MNRGTNTLAEEVNYTHFHYLITFLSCTDAAYVIHGEVTKMEMLEAKLPRISAWNITQHHRGKDNQSLSATAVFPHISYVN